MKLNVPIELILINKIMMKLKISINSDRLKEFSKNIQYFCFYF